MRKIKKYIIGIGCSWTQGEGGYPEHIWKEYNGRVQLKGTDDYHLRKYEHENSWVNVLSRDHFPEYEAINLGVRGIGNRAAVHQLHFCDKVDFSNSTGVIVFMLSGFERFDFFQENPKHKTINDDMYSNGEYTHYKWRTMWPAPDFAGKEKLLWTCYAKMLWSEQFIASEQMLALLDLQTFAKAHGYKVIVANAFNQRPEGIREYLLEYAGTLSSKFDWNTYVHNDTPYSCFIQKLVELDGLMSATDWGDFNEFYRKRNWPAEHLTNCNGAHPTIQGYKVIGNELAGFIKAAIDR